MEWLEIIVSILSGLAVTIPLVIKLVEWIQKAVKEQNWNQLITLVMNLMTEAEERFDNGSDRKTWVIEMVSASAKTINYDVDIEQVGLLIDSLCEMSNKVNASKDEEITK